MINRDHPLIDEALAGEPAVIPFFICAAFSAVAVMAVWLPGYTKRHPLLTYYGSSGWHAHEMLFGYMAAVVTPFLLSAVRARLGRPAAGPLPLALLILIWLAGRALPLMSDVPPWLVAAVDLAFLPLLIVLLALPLWRAGHRRELYLIVPLALMVFGNLLVHGEWLGLTADSARLGVVLAFYMLALLMSVAAAALMPRCLARPVSARPVLDWAAAGTIVLLAIADLFWPTGEGVAACALLAAAVHGCRLLTWLAAGPRPDPVSWGLLAGYAWLVTGFVLIALSYQGRLPPMLAFHALMVGAFGGLAMGMMAQALRARHVAARPVSTLAALAFALINVTALVRVGGPLLSLRYGQALIIAAGSLWIISFILFLLIYGPLLLPARAVEPAR